MPIKTSGPISITDIVAEFGGTAPHDLSKYYRGGGLVPNKNINSKIAAVNSGNPISLGQFYGASKIIELTYTLYGGGGAGGQGYENGAGSGAAPSAQDTVIMLKSEYDTLLAANNGVLPKTIPAAVTLARAAGGSGGAHGSRQNLSGGAGGDSDFGTGGSGGTANSAAPKATWGRWGVGGGGGGGDQGSSSGWNILGIIKYGSTDPWGQSGAGGDAGSKSTGVLDLDVDVEYVLIAGKAGERNTGVGNFNGAHGIPGVILFTVDTVAGTNYDVTPAGDGTSDTHRITSTVIGMKLNRAGTPQFFAV